MNILVTGGAGYIGSILTEQLVSLGHQVIVVDNLSSGHRAAVVPEAIFIEADLNHRESLDHIFKRHRVEAVMHLAAEKSVERSVADPGSFFLNNVTSGLVLLECMREHGVESLVFSSSAAVYGQPEKMPVTERARPRPQSAYGESKLMFERILYWYGVSHGIESISLRYFNVAGASKRIGAYGNSEPNLVPTVIEVAAGKMKYLSVYGTSYGSSDGTCVRDYVHVLDIARAHILALGRLGRNSGSAIYNLGTGVGHSVMEIVKTARKITGSAIPVEVRPRRSGDPEILISDSRLARVNLGWEPQYPELDSIIDSVWQWHNEHPNGCDSRNWDSGPRSCKT